MSIDWSKAPEGATHYDLTEDGMNMPWVKLSKERFYCWEDNIGWHGPLTANDEFLKDGSVDRLIPRPQRQPEWADGLPPVGVECEINPHGYYWFAATILAYGKTRFLYEISPGQVDIDGDPIGGEQSGFIKIVRFRPIPTKAQRQREELIAALKDFDKQRSIAWCEDAADFILSRYNLEPRS